MIREVFVDLERGRAVASNASISLAGLPRLYWGNQFSTEFAKRTDGTLGYIVLGPDWGVSVTGNHAGGFRLWHACPGAVNLRINDPAAHRIRRKARCTSCDGPVPPYVHFQLQKFLRSTKKWNTRLSVP